MASVMPNTVPRKPQIGMAQMTMREKGIAVVQPRGVGCREMFELVLELVGGTKGARWFPGSPAAGGDSSPSARAPAKRPVDRAARELRPAAPVEAGRAAQEPRFVQAAALFSHVEAFEHQLGGADEEEGGFDDFSRFAARVAAQMLAEGNDIVEYQGIEPDRCQAAPQQRTLSDRQQYPAELTHGEIPFSSSAVNRVFLTVFAQCERSASVGEINTRS